MIDETSSTGHGTATGGSAGMANAGTGTDDRSGSRTDPGLTGQIGEGARQAGETVRQHATGLAHTLMDEAGKQVERQRERLADRVVGVADIVRDTGQRLAEREPWIGRYIEQGAQGLTTLADGMRDRDPRDLIGQVTDFARRQPALFAGAAVALGFVFARMTRGSIEGAGGARNERWRSDGWQERGDYERASWQDREWQGASPGHAHDDERGYGFSAGSSGSYGQSGYGQSGYGQRGYGQGDPSRYGGPAGGGMAGSTFREGTDIGLSGGAAATGGGLGSTGSSSAGLGDERPSAGHSGPGSSHGQVSAVSGASGSVGASGSSVPGATAAAARERTYEDAKDAGQDGDETRIRNPETSTPFEPAVKAGGTATGSRTSPATGETPR